MIILLEHFSIYVPMSMILMPNLLNTIPCQKKQTLRNKKEWAFLSGEPQQQFSIATFKTKSTPI